MNEPNNKDPLVSKQQLIDTLTVSSASVANRLVLCQTKGTITRLDLLAMEPHLRSLHCAVLGLLASTPHDQPIQLNND